MPSLTIFFPCYNDAKSIGKLVKEADKTASRLAKDYEIIVVDDGSKDDSREILKGLKNKFKRLRLVFHEKNRGYGGVLQTGFKSAKKELVFYTDGDGQYDVGELKLLWWLMTDDVDIVNGIKMDRQDYRHRVVLGNLYAFLMRWLFLLKIIDVDCDFRLIRRDFLRKMSLNSTSGAVCVELVKRLELAGANFRQVEVHHYPRLFGSSQFFRPMRLVKTAGELANLWGEMVWRNKSI